VILFRHQLLRGELLPGARVGLSRVTRLTASESLGEVGSPILSQRRETLTQGTEKRAAGRRRPRGKGAVSIRRNVADFDNTSPTVGKPPADPSVRRNVAPYVRGRDPQFLKSQQKDQRRSFQEKEITTSSLIGYHSPLSLGKKFIMRAPALLGVTLP